ncbi:LytR/AlgR family response regulator transcription factor [Anaerobacillus sp. MEB173]|uniref:LytR/AlgR family response regulator transcription factor n=1 Tax=Anaerobacillus sp. MEB173 TaxID=3383345 RepID=UPI003F93087A
MSIKVMIAEDEKLAREELEFIFSEYTDIELCPSVINGRELLEKVEEYQPDVVFLDIEMPELAGIDAAKKLRERESSPLIVFTTAYDQYAVDAFGLNAVDYLLKPYTEERLEEALSRVRKELQRLDRPASANEKEKSEKLTTAKNKEQSPKISKLLLDDGNRVSVVNPASIYYVMRDERVVRIFTKDNEYESKFTLQELEEKLAPYHFFRSHRSYLVNLDVIEEIQPWFNRTYNLVLKDHPKTKIPVSRAAAKDLMKILQGKE